MEEKAYSKGRQVYDIFRGKERADRWKGLKVIKVEW
jgi:hypothetical protein